VANGLFCIVGFRLATRNQAEVGKARVYNIASIHVKAFGVFLISHRGWPAAIAKVFGRPQLWTKRQSVPDLARPHGPWPLSPAAKGF